MNFTPKVSIIIPVYNGSNYLKYAIESAISQNYVNFEIIVVNDGSNDGGATERIALSYGDKIRYFSKPNGGVATALNFGIKNMSGEYFSWLSHDDVYLPSKISSQIEYLTHLENKHTVLFSDFEIINESGVTLHKSIFDHNWLVKKPLYALLRSCIHGCSLLIAKSFFEKYGLFDESLKTTQDYDLWFKMIRHEKFIHIPQILIQSRQHPEQDTFKHPETNKEANILWIMMMKSLSKEEMLSCENSVFDFYLKMYLFLANNSPYDQATEYALQMAKKSSVVKYLLYKFKIRKLTQK